MSITKKHDLYQYSLCLILKIIQKNIKYIDDNYNDDIKSLFINQYIL